jgi:sirohydrochlorin ferrochelatase
MNSRRVLLLDNGSLEPASTRQLRELAAALAARVGHAVEPVSLAHSARIPPDKLDGRPAELFGAALERCGREGVTDLAVVPLFVGPSHALTRVVPALMAERRKTFPRMRVRVAGPLQEAGETRLGGVVAELVREKILGGERPRVAVVDHGSPVRAVSEARDAIVAQVRALLGEAVAEVAACSMERRPGAEHDGNGPRLETLLAAPEWRSGPLVVALLFVAPGRHAGAEGDVVKICRRARGGLAEVAFTRVLGRHPRIVELLAERCRAARSRTHAFDRAVQR